MYNGITMENTLQVGLGNMRILIIYYIVFYKGEKTIFEFSTQKKYSVYSLNTSVNMMYIFF